MTPYIQKTTLKIAKTLFITSILAIYLSILLSYPLKNDPFILATNFVIVIYSIYRSFFSHRYNYSTYQLFYIFSLLFMGLAPMVQYKQSVETVGGYDISNYSYMITNIYLIVTFILIDFIYSYRQNKQNRVTEERVSKLSNCNVKDNMKLKILLLMLSSISLVYVIYINQLDLAGIIYRDTLINRIEIENNMTMILAGIIRPLSIFSFIYYYKIGQNKTFKFILFIIAIITSFPFALTRFLIGAYWLPVIVTIFHSLEKKNVLGYVYTLGFLILFPAFEIFRAFSVYLERGSLNTAFINKIFEAFSSISYDSYQSLAFVIQNQFITAGRQLIGVFGIFIPRSYWENKPIGSGFTVSDKFNLGWDNISMNFFGEGFVNFGVIGIIIFAIALAIAMRFLDNKYWLKKEKNCLLYPAIYLVILGIFAYILRGDMMGSFTSTLGVILSATLVYSMVLVSRKIQG
jgi:hypothetical protein